MLERRSPSAYADSGIMEPEAYATGQVIAGKYRLDERLAVGGMGAVYAATHLELDERVAIKLLLPAALNDATAVERFAREARAAAKVRGDHVVRIFDVGKLESGLPFIVMELLSGVDLDRLAQGKKLPVEEAVDLLLEALLGVAEAHARGVVHRDLKPANLFITTRPDGSRSVKVLDFGVSKTQGSVSITQTQAFIGSPSFMSPEQWDAAKDIDHRADIWAIGAILYQLLAQRPPFDGKTVAQLCNAVLHDAPKPLRDVPDALDAVVRRCLAKAPAGRFSDVAELAAALAPFVEGGDDRAEAIRVILGGARAQVIAKPRVHPLRSAAPVLVVVALLLVVGAFALRSGATVTTPAPPPRAVVETIPTSFVAIATPAAAPTVSEAVREKPRIASTPPRAAAPSSTASAPPLASSALTAPIESAPVVRRSDLGGRH
jgi:eukaryotic-like serine/threonine-protein kinase